MLQTDRPLREWIRESEPQAPSLTRSRTGRLAVVISWALLTGVNFIGRDLFPHNVSDQERRGPELLIEPAGGAFAIWGLIFAGLGAGAAYQALQTDDRLSPGYLPLAISFSCGALWPVAIGYDRTVLAQGLLFGMLASAVVAYQRLKPQRERADRAESLTVHAPLSLYMGWLSVAAVVGSASVLTADFGVSPDALGVPELAWTCAGIGLAATCGVVVGQREQDYVYNAAIAWGLGGMAVKHKSPALRGAVGVALALMAAGLGAGMLNRRRVLN